MLSHYRVKSQIYKESFNVFSRVMAFLITEEAVGAQKSCMITAGGTYRIGGVGGGGVRNFSQTFVITAHSEKWKIASDVFRTQIHPTQANS